MPDIHAAGVGAVAIGGAPISGTSRETFTLSATLGSYTLTGIAVDIGKNRKLQPATGSYPLTGIAVRCVVARRIALTTGTYALSGKPTLRRLAMPAAVKAMALTGYAAGLRATRVMAAGKYMAPGFAGIGAAPVSGAPVSGGIDNVPPAVTYALSGRAVTLRLALPLAAGAYALTGRGARTLKGSVVHAATGSYALSGKAVRLLAARRSTFAKGSYAYTGRDAVLRVAIPGTVGVYALFGRPVGLRATRLMQCGHAVPSVAGVGGPAIADVPIAGGDAARRVIGSYALIGGPVFLTNADRHPKVQAIAS